MDYRNMNIVCIFILLSLISKQFALRYKGIQLVLRQCALLCDVIRFNYDVSDDLQCGVHCEEDADCAFYHWEYGECYLCTHDTSQHDHFTSMEKKAYIAAHGNANIYEKYPKIGCSVDCSVYKRLGFNVSGEYDFSFPGNITVRAYCDMDTDGGGWTVFQRRMDGSVDFYRNWEDFENGFGNLSTEFWLGNEIISVITEQGSYELRLDLEDYDNEVRFAVYGSFYVNSTDDYRLTLGDYVSGDAGDSMINVARPADGMKWSTYDRDNDVYANVHCAERYKGAWWHSKCQESSLNGEYGNDNSGEGINWKIWKGWLYSLKFTEMKLRPANYN